MSNFNNNLLQSLDADTVSERELACPAKRRKQCEFDDANDELALRLSVCDDFKFKPETQGLPSDQHGKRFDIRF